MRKRSVPTKEELKTIEAAGKNISFDEWMALEHNVRIKGEYYLSGVDIEGWVEAAGYIEGWEGNYYSKENAIQSVIENFEAEYRDWQEGRRENHD